MSFQGAALSPMYSFGLEIFLTERERLEHVEKNRVSSVLS
jgi:hypothetical protein